jgi:large exoprotein involved in heme utilization and adhesion
MLTGVENIEGTTEGNGGLLRITTQDLTIRDGAVLQTNTFDAGNAGNLVVNADSIDVSGTSIDNLNPSGITAYSGGIPGTNFRRVATATGRSGDLTVNARELTVRNGAVIAAGSVNPNRNANAAGNLMINTQRLNLNDRSSLLANTNSGNGGEIQLRIEDLLLLGENSAISTTAGLIGRGGDGGSITINDRTDTLPDGFIVANPSGNSDITANANQGSGGNVEISSRGILGLRPLDRSELAERLNNPTNPAELDPQRLSTSDITAISQVSPNLSGQITFNAPDVDPSRGLVELPTDLIDRSQQIAQTCAPRDTQNSFVTTGRSGLPLSPDEVLRSAAVIPLDWVTLDSESENLSTSRTHDRAEETTESASENSSQYQNESEIIEATEWSQDANGNVTLIAQSTLPQFPSHACTSPLSP